MGKAFPRKRGQSSESLESLLDRKEKVLQELSSYSLLIHGSLYSTKIKCGKPNCRCATGEGHEMYYLALYNHGKERSTEYIPKKMLSDVKKSLEQDEKAKALLDELSQINLELFQRRELYPSRNQ